MKITMAWVAAGAGPHGLTESWVPGQDVEVDNSDKQAVAWARMMVAAGAAELVEDVPAKETPKAPVSRGSRA
jgi:hypothetical protein